MATTISRNEYLTLVAMLDRARRRRQDLAEILCAAQDVVGDYEDNGHAADAVHGNTEADADELLRRYGITVEGR